MVAGVGGGVPAVRSAPLSVVAGAGVPSFALVSVFFFFFFRRRKTEVSEREIDSRRRHSACETVIAMHLVK